MTLSRFAAELPAVDEFVSLGEGGTPAVPLPALARRLGLSALSAKLESQNPTGSYKDRVAAMSVSLAKRRGDRGWIATSSGNAGLSFAAYGARAGLPGFLCVVSTAPAEKRAALMPYGIGIASVAGVGHDADRDTGAELMDLVRAQAARHRLFLGITANAFNPDGMRGIDTIGYELAEQVGGATHVYVPTGGGGLLASLARGLARRGVAARVIACQPRGCAPIARYLAGELGEIAVPWCDTTISALQLTDPPDGALAVEAVKRTGGWGVTASDEEILAAQRLLAEVEGVFAEPASATAVAALAHDVAAGRVTAGDHPVVIITGGGWKDLSRFADAARRLPTTALADIPARVEAWLREGKA